MTDSDFRLYCSRGTEYSVRVPEKILLEIDRYCGQHGRTETGGILIGNYSKDLRVANILRVTGPPPDSRHFAASFLRGVQGLQGLIDSLWTKERKFYLGEWHFHPLGSPALSADDIKQMQANARSDAYACPEPILLIAAGLVGDLEIAISVHPKHQTFVALQDVTAL